MITGVLVIGMMTAAISASFCNNGGSTGRIRVTEMKLTSQTASPTRSPISS